MVKELAIGTYISFKLNGAPHSGLVLPSTTKETLFLKLENGYNIGVKHSDIKDVKKVKKIVSKSVAPTLKGRKNLPKIVIITTGGTITSRVDYKTSAVHPLTKPEELLAQVPELAKLASIKVIPAISKLSANMMPRDWQALAKIVHKELEDKSICGAIITHGTDTLHYTSAALSFMLGKLDKPVALVGGQRSSDRGSFDGAQNLICAVHYCLAKINKVAIVMHGSSEDTYCLAISGLLARKFHTSRRDAFRPINSLPIAKIYLDGTIERYKIHYASTKFSTSFESKIALIKYAPGLNVKIFEKAVRKSKGIIIEGTGMGHVGSEWFSAIRKAIKKGVFIGMTSQCIYGRVDPHVYSYGRELLDMGVVYLENMLSEVAYVKIGYVLSHTKKMAEIRKRMCTNLCGEIVDRIPKSTFLY